MNAANKYQEINRQSWNERTATHIKSDFYDVAGFLAGKTSLNSIEIDLLGNIRGKSVLHLQCHFGQDSISLARLGAKVTGVDLSDQAIEEARQLAEKAGEQVTFICCDVYDLPRHLDKKFDIVYTSYGVIGWLPDMDRWAQIVAGFLKPQGRFVFAEFHPFVWAFDNQFKEITYNYFKDEPIVETIQGSYADQDTSNQYESITWNHSLSEVINPLIQHGLRIDSLDEFDYSPYDCFEGTVEVAPGKYRIAHMGNKIPMVYAVHATKV